MVIASVVTLADAVEGVTPAFTRAVLKVYFFCSKLPGTLPPSVQARCDGSSALVVSGDTGIL